MKRWTKWTWLVGLWMLAWGVIPLTGLADDPEAVELLKGSYVAQREVAHTGTLRVVRFQDDKRMISTAEVHQANGKTRMDYYLGQQLRLSVMDDGNQITRLDPVQRRAMVHPIPFPPGSISLLLSNHQVSLAGEAKVADRSTRIITVDPLHPGNPFKKLWIDAETLLPLKKEHYDSDGTLLTRTLYTQIRYDVDIRDTEFEIPEGWHRPPPPPPPMPAMSLEELNEAIGFDILEPTYIPPGYLLEGYYLAEMGRGKGAHLRYTNGLNSISVFERHPPWLNRFMGRFRRERPPRGERIESGERHGPRDGRGRRGPRDGPGSPPERQDAMPTFLGNSSGKMIRTGAHGLHIIFVGDIAEAELQQMSDSLP